MLIAGVCSTDMAWSGLATGPLALVMRIEYVSVVMPFWAMTTVLMVLEPTAKAMLPDAVPELTVTPSTFIVAVLSMVVAVTVTDAVALLTDVVYVVVAPTVPVLINIEAGVSLIALSKALVDGARVTVMV